MYIFYTDCIYNNTDYKNNIKNVHINQVKKTQN